MKFLCDEMLRDLGRWLRTAGYDTVQASAGTSDRALLEQAVAEGRLLLTRDRKLAEFRDAVDRVVVLEGLTLDAMAPELAARGVDWLYRPFSRCLECNRRLENARPEDRTLAPPDQAGPLWRCPACGRIYWEGSHVSRMRARLRAWHGASS